MGTGSKNRRSSEEPKEFQGTSEEKEDQAAECVGVQVVPPK